jgi:glycosyltransferase involved in cell wall biosynthesis
VLVGPVLNVSGKEAIVEQLRAAPNVHFLGARPATQLAAYMQQFDVCLMCYELNNYTRYIYPLKLHEYLATGRPVVSSALESVKEFTPAVAIAASDDEWLAAIEAGLGPEDAGAATPAIRQSIAEQHDWRRLTEIIATNIRSALARQQEI